MAFSPTPAAKASALSAITKPNGTARGIPTEEMLEYVYGAGLPKRNTAFRAALNLIDTETNNLYVSKGFKTRDQGALNNCHGRWSEALFALYAWNTIADINSKRKDNTRYVYIKLPDRKNPASEWTSLLLEPNCINSLNEFVLDNSHPIVKKSDHNQLLLIASNPDSIILKFDDNDLNTFGLPISVTSKFSSFTAADLAMLDSLYIYFKDKVLPSENLVALLSLKASLRGDRRYQFIREGDNAKSILMYLYTMKADKGLSTAFFSNRFYCFTFEAASQDDKNVMDAAMSAYVSSPIIDPVWAVDKLYECLTLSNVTTAIREIIKKSG